MRGTCVGVIPDLNEVIIKFDDVVSVDRGDVVEVNIPKEKRSKNANALYWELNGRLAKKLNVSGEAIYKHHIKDMSNFECMLMVTKSVPAFEKMWNSGHLGRFVETRESKEPERTIVLAYYGSSDFDTRQMNHLIDNIIQDCENNDIPTYNQDEVDRLVAAWGR